MTTADANDVIILDIVQNGTTVSSVSDAAGLIWHQRAVAGTGLNTIYEYYAIAPNALSTDAITVNFTGTASYADLNAFGISGANTSSPFDSDVPAPVTSATSTGTVTTGNANDFVFAGYRFASDTNPVAGTSWTAINASGGYYLSEYQITSATQAGLVATASTADENGGIVDAVRAASSPTSISSIVASPGSVTANGISTTTLTVTVEDANGNPVNGTAVTLSASGSGNTFGSANGITNANGVFTTTLASTVAQTETITATEGSAQETTPVTFVAGTSSMLIKPNGLPTFVSGNPLAADMLFYGVDLGNGTIVDVAGGNTMIAADPLPPTITTPYGSGIGWNNQAYVLGDGYYANVDTGGSSAIQNALDLAAAGPGAGFTFGCTFVQLGPVVNSVNSYQGASPQTGVMIFGRPAYAAEAPPYWNEAFTTAGGDSTAVDLILNDGNASDVVGTYNFGTYGTLVSVICTVENTGSGSGIAKFFAASGNSPGALIATATISATSTYGFDNDNENQIMFGSVYHVLTGYGWDSFDGPVYSGFISGIAWTDAEAIAWLSNPYELLNWNTNAPAAPTITGVNNYVGTLSNGATITNDPDLLVQVSLSNTGAIAGDTVQLYNGTSISTPLGNSYTLTSSDISNGFADVQTGLLTNGASYDLTARLSDQVGNQSVASTAFTVIENTTAPSPALWASGVSGTWQTGSD